uniref:Peptidase C14 caspase domain-containing protein n=1 Tax=Cyclophora tenuis TaxID=216820 RepID=A0A7S1CX21_CYCTE|mmetsp:Transcript_11001/g.18642  ORF Transcript_11001/g.18642 Transcript_11001/m.18642 type:complete len:311 (+) Transcript_11001:150-1082(+)|eukprot:CAMPEP_0116565408 /NCGR_PEP_ID=MMETSP0397-20121206/13884_1 /TAXON_ID=216820 /ORGANISM="Cyclophora tenuis, Strain ECT3854" /LENGTH=310 /DNA_ID=CAMNT_0004092183 /DNA_START=87 /DNA_END=1019 /DNA_ORIENTATION=+
MGWLLDHMKKKYEDKSVEAFGDCTVMMISGCEDAQTSADVSNVASFRLPDPAGRAGGACTSVLLNVLYEDEKELEEDLSFTEVLQKMREILESRGYSQIPQLTSNKSIDVEQTFDLVPNETTGTRHALMIGINYVGHEQGVLSGCHNDVGNMKNYIMAVHGFPEENITVLMDDGEHEMPTKENIIAAYRKIVEEAEPGDAVFLHYSGHGCKIPDDSGDEDDGYDEALVPFDYTSAGVIRDDDLFNIIVKPLKDGVTLTSLMDCCHSGTILDLPYMFKADGNQTAMEIDEGFNFDKLFGKLGSVFRKLDIL